MNEMNKKIKILVVPSDRAGVGSWRSINPHVFLEQLFPNDFEVVINYEVNWDDLEYLKQFQLIHGHRTLCSYEKMEELVKKLNESGVVVVLDIDDGLKPGKAHPAYFLVMEEKLPEKILMALKTANYVTTTSPRFKKELEKDEIKNVVIFPNAIDSQAKQWIPKPESNGLVRVGFLGGSSHLEDLKILTPMFQSLRHKAKDKFQAVLVGFDVRGAITEIAQDGSRKTRPVQPLETCWYKYEQIFTDNYKSLEDFPDYIKFLHKFKEEKYPNEENMSYVRRWTRPLSTYSMNYNLFDISLAPLVTNDGLFNHVKSNLKVVEAGFYKKALIAQDADPYSHDIIHGVNGFLVNPNKPQDWAKYALQLINNPQMIKDMGEALYETVKDKYEIRTVTKTRAEFYKQIVQDMNEKMKKEFLVEINAPNS